MFYISVPVPSFFRFDVLRTGMVPVPGTIPLPMHHSLLRYQGMTLSLRPLVPFDEFCV
jgi:hypothetical protein